MKKATLLLKLCLNKITNINETNTRRLNFHEHVFFLKDDFYIFFSFSSADMFIYTKCTKQLFITIIMLITPILHLLPLLSDSYYSKYQSFSIFRSPSWVKKNPYVNALVFLLCAFCISSMVSWTFHHQRKVLKK